MKNLPLVGVDCNCYTEGYAHQSITLCPLHESAPELLEVLEAMKNCGSLEEAEQEQLFEKAETLIAKAKGKS